MTNRDFIQEKMSNMKTFTRVITITIDRCNHCHYFNPFTATWPSKGEYCEHYQERIQYDILNHLYPIPDWCKIDEEEKGDVHGQGNGARPVAGSGLTRSRSARRKGHEAGSVAESHDGLSGG